LTAVVLCNPKTPYNVGAAIRACSIYEIPTLRWTGDRIATAEGRRKAGSSLKNRPRLPREERLKDYANVDWREGADDVVSSLAAQKHLTPVAVELVPGAEFLHEFVHPGNALYVFGPEDGNIPKGMLAVCHRFVRIPTCNRTPLNLAAALNVVLYDRHAKTLRGWD
jgi:tRNA(Leu) C34 or U34 (ribose-2'-O)-methylase TrmL